MPGTDPGSTSRRLCSHIRAGPMLCIIMVIVFAVLISILKYLRNQTESSFNHVSLRFSIPTV